MNMRYKKGKDNDEDNDYGNNTISLSNIIDDGYLINNTYNNNVQGMK
jgi:hypothetical protein